MPSQSTVCELYGGVGVIGLNLLGKVKELRLSDINPFLPMSVDKIVAQLSEVSLDPSHTSDLLDLLM